MAHIKEAHPFIPQRGHSCLEISRTTRKGTDTIPSRILHEASACDRRKHGIFGRIP